MRESVTTAKKKSAAIVIFSSKTVLLCKRATKCYLTKEPIPFPDYWSFIAGAIESGESSIDCVIREAKEEVDVKINKDNVSYFGDFKNSSDKKIDLYYCFLENLPKIKLNPEHVSYMWYDYSYINEFPYTIDPALINLIKKIIKKEPS